MSAAANASEVVVVEQVGAAIFANGGISAGSGPSVDLECLLPPGHVALHVMIERSCS
jgi:hypothetical protein